MVFPNSPLLIFFHGRPYKSYPRRMKTSQAPSEEAHELFKIIPYAYNATQVEN